jgi:hypothetical protein
MPYPLLQSYFIDVDDYVSFLEKSSTRTIANNEGTCMAELRKENGHFIFLLHWLEDGKMIGDYVLEFEPTPENIQTFNEGCRILAERMIIYLETNDPSAVPSEPPAFGRLTKVLELEKSSKLKRQIQNELGLDLPISGGMGLSLEDTIVVHPRGKNEDVKTEYLILDSLSKLEGIAWKRLGQKLLRHNDRYYDEITLEIQETHTVDGLPKEQKFYFDVTECWGM